MTNPTPNNTNNTDETNTTNDTQSWWSSFTSTPVTNDASSFNADSFTEEAESADWLKIFKKKQ